MAEKDYADIMFDAMSVLIDKKIESVKFDQTINATIVDATKASEGVYVVTTGNAKFTAYSTEVEYKENDAVLVMIPQGNYDNQKMIIGKQVDDSNTPLVYKSPFQGLVNITNNLIQGKHEIGYWANDPTAEDGRPWNIDNNDFRTSTVFTNNLVIWDSQSDDTFISCQGYTRLGISAQFSTWLADYGTYTGNYGLAIEITFKSIESSDDEHNSFTKIITFDSKEFFGDVYNFETYYTQENVYDISDYIDYPIRRLRLFVYQRENFVGTNGERVPYNDAGGFGNINPNIFIKDPYLCLGIPVEDFNEDMATLMTMDSTTYYKGNLSPENGVDISQRFFDNEKIIGLRWVHKDVENDIIKTVEPDEFPDMYEVRWYRFRLGAKSPDIFAGAHWQRLYAPLASVDQDGNYYLTSDADRTEQEFKAADELTNKLEIYFWPNVNNETEKVKVVIVKNEGTENNPIYRKVAQSNILEFTNETDVRNKASIIDMNALSIQFVDESGEMADCLGTYFIYDRADKVLNDGDKEIRFLQLAFDPDEPNVYSKAELVDWQSIKWYVPCGSDTMITPAYPATAAAQPIQAPNENNYYTITNITKIAFFVKPVLNRYAGRNTVHAEVIKDGQEYTAEAQMVFGTSGTSGSDYTIQLIWHHGRNAIDVTEEVLNTEPSENLDGSSLGDRKVLEGELVLYDQNGQIVPDDDFTWELDWEVAERTDTEASSVPQQPVFQETDYYYPVYLGDNFITFKQGQLDDGKDDTQRVGHYYYYTLDDIFDSIGLVLTEDGIEFSNIQSNQREGVFNNLSKFYCWDIESNSFVNCIELYNQNAANNLQLTQSTISSANVQNAFLDKFSDTYTSDEGDVSIKYKQFYYKTHETESIKKKKQIIFEPIENIYSNNEENTVLSLSSQAANDVFFMSNVSSISKEEFFQEIQRGAIPLSVSPISAFINILENFAVKYKEVYETLSAVNNYTWKITVGLNGPTLRSTLLNRPNHSSGKYLKIELIKLLLDYSNDSFADEHFGGLYYEDTRFYIDHLGESNDPDSLDVDILQELYFLIFNKKTSIPTVNELQQQYFYEVIENMSVFDELLVINENSADIYAYKNNGEIVLLAPGTRLTCGVLRFLFNSSDVSFYKIVTNDQLWENDNTIPTTQELKDNLKQNFRYAVDDPSLIYGSMESILSRFIDYKTRTKEEIQNLNLGISYMTIDGNDLKELLVNSLNNGYSLKDAISELHLNTQQFQSLVYDRNGLNDCLLYILDRCPETSIQDQSLSTPGFVQTQEYSSVIEREKQKWYLEEKFKSINDEEEGGIFVLEAIRTSHMRKFSNLKLPANANNNTLLSSIDMDEIVIGMNPDSSSQYDYVNILYQLQFLLTQNQDELLTALKAVHNDTDLTISTVESSIMNASNISEYTDEAYLYGKYLFRYIKNYLASASGNKYILSTVNNLGLLFRLMFKEDFYTDLNKSRWGKLSNNDLGFYKTYMSSALARANTTYTGDIGNIGLASIGTFTKSSDYYTNEFKESVSESPDGTLRGVEFLTYCASKQSTGYETSGGNVVVVLPEGYTEDDVPKITINKTNKTIIYTGVTTIKKSSDAGGGTLTLNNLQSNLKSWIESKASVLFVVSNVLTLTSGADIYSLYNFKKNGGSGAIVGYYIDGTYYPNNYANIQFLVWQAEQTGSTIEIVYASGIFEYTQYLVSDADSSLICTISNETKDPGSKSNIRYNGGSFDNLTYQSLCQTYFPSNGSHPDFASLLMDLIIQFWPTSGNANTGILSALFGASYVKPVSNAQDTFGESSILIFLPYQSYYDEGLIYFSSINKILSRQCVSDNQVNESLVYSKVLEKIKSHHTIMQLSPDNRNFFYTMLMRMLFSGQIYQDVDHYYSENEQKQLILDILLSNEDIFWQCYDCKFNVTYPSSDIDIDYNIANYIDISIPNEDPPPNLFKEFANDANNRFLQVIDVLPELRKKDQLKTKMFTLLKRYYQRQDFYQFQELESNEQTIENLYTYISTLCFRSPLDRLLYLMAKGNLESNRDMNDTNTERLLRFLYLQGPDLNDIEDPSATTWLDTILASMDYVNYLYVPSVGYDYNYYISINGTLYLIKNLFANYSYPVQELYTYINYSDFYTLNKTATNKTAMSQIVINNNPNIKRAIPATKLALLSSLIQSLFYDKQSDGTLVSKSQDVDICSYIMNALSRTQFDISEKIWYYKAENKQTKEAVKDLFTSLNINDFLTEIVEIKESEDKAQFYKVDNTISTTKYFYFYNPWEKKAFIKRNGNYILDPYDNFILGETYYYPLQSTKTIAKIALLRYEQHGGNLFQIRPKDDSSTSILLRSLNILKVVLKDFGDYNLTSYFPIPLKSGTVKQGDQITYQIRYIEGADSVWYPVTGQPEYYQNPYKIFAQRIGPGGVLENFEEITRHTDTENVDIQWEPIYYLKPGEHDNFLPSLPPIEKQLDPTDPVQPILKPVVIYIKNAKHYGVICKKNGSIIWSQPIWVYQDRYPSTTVNQWNGKDIVLDDDAGMVLASAFAAGTKDENNQFSGVMLGYFGNDVSSLDKTTTGIYGFYKGDTSYAFLDSGTGYIGRSGKGRIWFDGENSQIYSGHWQGVENLGMLIDLDNGLINMRQRIQGYKYNVYKAMEIADDITGKKNIDTTTKEILDAHTNIKLDAEDSRYALQVYSDSNDLQKPSFKVGWAGDVHIENGSIIGAYIEGSLIKGSDIIANYIQSDRGWLGGWVVNPSSLSSPPAQAGVEGFKSWTVLSPLTGIKTNTVTIETSVIDGPDLITGQLGYVQGEAIQNIGGIDTTVKTDAIGIKSSGNIIIQSTGADTGIKAANDVWLHSTGNHRVQMLSGNSSVNVENGKVTIKGSELYVNDINANNQHGIYARFA